jgi:hypothetical protein
VRALEPVEALHTAARRYCEDRAAEWRGRSFDLERDEERERRRIGAPEPVEYGYSPEMLATFPRYNVLYAIQTAVEAFTPADLGPLHEARELLAEAGATADSIFTREPNGDIERRAMGEERELFRRYVLSIREDELAEVEPLPFRRTLTEEESASLWHELERRWGVKGYWYPIDRAQDAPPPAHTVAFDSDPFHGEELERLLRDVLSSLGVVRVWELREQLGTDMDKEIELGILEPVYTGEEGFWTDGSFDWLVYASHEGSVTVAGSRLLPALQAAWPAWNRHLYDPSW